jgi:hypothetical protein
MHLTDPGFANPVEGSDSTGGARKPGLSPEEIAKVKQDWEDLQRRKKEKEEAKKKEKDDKEKTENEKADGKEDKETGKHDLQGAGCLDSCVINITSVNSNASAIHSSP